MFLFLGLQYASISIILALYSVLCQHFHLCSRNFRVTRFIVDLASLSLVILALNDCTFLVQRRMTRPHQPICASIIENRSSGPFAQQLLCLMGMVSLGSHVSYHRQLEAADLVGNLSLDGIP
jgi:hypothetical protein